MVWTDLPETFAKSAARLRFRNSDEINEYFLSRHGAPFPDWFNANRRAALWDGKRIPAAGARSFAKAWNNAELIFGERPSLLQFLCLSCIMVNETGGTFEPISENFGYRGHPGIAYLFDAIPQIPKASYNRAPNLTAGFLFNDPDFIAAHGGLALADKLKNTSDPRWQGEIYPKADFPTAGRLEVTGFILQADFFKFRGRGLIQTTWRPAYQKLIRFVQAYAGDQPVINKYKAWWGDMSAAKAATVSDNEDWDDLFQKTDLVVASHAIALHNAGASRYLTLAADAAGLNGKSGGSIYNVGLRVSGGAGYAAKFRSRVIELCEAIGG